MNSCRYSGFWLKPLARSDCGHFLTLASASRDADESGPERLSDMYEVLSERLLVVSDSAIRPLSVTQLGRRSERYSTQLLFAFPLAIKPGACGYFWFHQAELILKCDGVSLPASDWSQAHF